VKHYYEIKPGQHALSYLLTYGFLTLLSKRAAKRKHRMFAQLSGSIDRHVLAEGYFEAGVLNLLEELCRKTGHTERMIDIGANIGNHTVGLAHLFRNVEAVEPHPVLFKVLEANVLGNNLGNVTCHNIGLAAEDAKGTLVESATEHGLSHVQERSRLAPEVFGLSSEQFGARHSVNLISAESFARQFEADMDRTFIKIDVEGMEEEIMRALAPILATYKPLVGFEWFTRSQPNLARFVLDFEGYELWGIRVHDKGRNYLARAAKMVFFGRSYTLEKLNPDMLDDVYPLAMVIPKHRNS
jgi:FkbM family methyltransferase